MFQNFLQKFKDAKSEMRTYRFGLLQTKAYRILKNQTDQLLEKYDISSVEWAILGALYDAKESATPSEMAEALDVEMSFVTQTAKVLIKKGLITIEPSAEDKRSKCLLLTTNAKKLVPQIEAYLRKGSGFLIDGIAVKDILNYRRVILAIIANSKKKK